MSELNKLFENAPEGAVELREHADFTHLRWFNVDGHAWDGIKWVDSKYDYKTIATRPQPEPRKTVEDVYEGFDGKWRQPEDFVCIWNTKTNNFEFWLGNYNPVSHCYLVCDYQQFEAYAKEQEDKSNFKATRQNLEKIAKDAQGDFVEVEQEGEKWTHEIRATKEYCYISEGPNDSGQVFIKTNKGIWDCLYVEQLKPIKPTITKAEREKCAALAGYFNINPVEFDEYMEKYDSAEGPAND